MSRNRERLKLEAFAPVARDLQPRLSGHTNVENDYLGSKALRESDRCRTIIIDPDDVSLSRENRRKKIDDVRVVVDQEYASRSLMFRLRSRMWSAVVSNDSKKRGSQHVWP